MNHWHTLEKLDSLIPANINLSKVNNRNTRKRCETCSKLTIKTPEEGQWRLLVSFWCLLLTWDRFHTLFWRLYCWLWTNKCRLSIFIPIYSKENEIELQKRYINNILLELQCFLNNNKWDFLNQLNVTSKKQQERKKCMTNCLNTNYMIKAVLLNLVSSKFSMEYRDPLIHDWLWTKFN